MKLVSVLVFTAALLGSVRADIYLHNPRGSNNRLDEANRDRANGNRLFDSQNNNRGGSNVGSMYYYVGSKLPIEWTNQHSCGHENNNCNLVVQYHCGDWVRDGASTNRIPENNRECYNHHCDTDLEYGRHESYDWYKQCKYTERNQGLFTSNQNLNNNEKDCRFTRQNPDNNRRGYECPEERDYYPYWRPSPWVDVAVLTNDTTRCAYYQAESQNVKDRWHCVLPTSVWNTKVAAADSSTQNGNTGFLPITKAKCETAALNGTWTRVPAWGVPAPVCMEPPHSRDNHLGNVHGGEHARFNWTVTALPEAMEPYREYCVMRVRYNISTTDYNDWDSWVSDSLSPFDKVHNVLRASVDYRNNANATNPDADEDPAWVKLWERFGLAYHEVEKSFTTPSEDAVTDSREYVLKNNPKVDIFNLTVARGDAHGDTTLKRIKFQLAINTNQFGRTFQDRTHTFAIRPMPESISQNCPVVHNLNVRGKRGNIVQTYPGTEYDFVPDRLEVATDDCIHYQWTGSNTNPNNNAGQGKQGTDRSNIVLQKGNTWDEFAWQHEAIAANPSLEAEILAGNGTDGLPIWGTWGRSYPEHLTIARVVEDFDMARRLAIQDDPHMHGNVHGGQMGGEMSELDDAGTYFDLGPVKMSTEGHFHYMCTRNNNFSNRSQKGKIIVTEAPVISEPIGYAGGTITAPGAKGFVPSGMLATQSFFSIRQMPPSWLSSSTQRNAISDIVWVEMAPSGPGALTLTDTTDGKWTVSVKYSAGSLQTPKLYVGPDLDSPTFDEVNNVNWITDSAGQTWAEAKVSPPGSYSRRRATSTSSVYFVSSTTNIVPIIAGVVCSIILVGLIVASVVYFKRHPEKWESSKRRAYNFKRSFSSKV
jgi:hypothetical protein